MALRKTPNQPLYLQSRAAQSHSMVKAGYCVKQGALVSLFLDLVFIDFITHYILLNCEMKCSFSLDEELETEVFRSGAELHELLQV